jgi:26S proteasome regulatory subunit N2
MDIDEDTSKDKETKTDEKKEGEGEKESVTSAEIAKKKLEKEKVGYDIENMSRVLPAQLKFINFPAGRYKPVKKVSVLNPKSLSLLTFA